MQIRSAQPRGGDADDDVRGVLNRGVRNVVDADVRDALPSESLHGAEVPGQNGANPKRLVTVERDAAFAQAGGIAGKAEAIQAPDDQRVAGIEALQPRGERTDPPSPRGQQDLDERHDGWTKIVLHAPDPRTLMHVLCLNCTLKLSPEPSNTADLAQHVLTNLKGHGFTTEMIRVTDHVVDPGVISEPVTKNDDWPLLH